MAKLAGVSQSTVSRCLNDSPLVAAETKARVKKLAEQYSFQFNTNARGLKTSSTGMIGYVFSEDFTGFANHYIQSDIYYRLRLQLAKEGLNLVPVFDDKRFGENFSIEKSISSRRYDALIFNRPQVDDSVRRLLDRTKIPYIFIYDTDETSNEPYMIAISHTQIGALVARAFCKAGYSRFVEVCGPMNRIDVKHKMDGFAGELYRHGFEIPQNHVLCANYHLGEATKVTIENRSLFKAGTACFAQNDLMALGVLEGLKQCGIRVPEEVAVIGSDNIPMGCWFTPHLTTVAVDYHRVIELSVNWAMAMRSHTLPATYRYVLNSKLTIRDTFQCR